MKLGKYLSAALFCSVLSNAAYSWDGQVTGKVQRIDVGDSTEAFRVILENGPALCANTNIWAYVARTQPNYQTYVSVILAAQLAGKNITVYTTRDANGYCLIGYLALTQ